MATNDDAKGLKKAADNLKEINSTVKTTKTLLNEAISPFESLNKISEKLLEHRTRENALSAEQLKQLAVRIAKEEDNLLKSQQALALREKQLKEEEKTLNNILKKHRATTQEYKAAAASLKSITSEIQQNAKSQTVLKKQISETTGEVAKLKDELEKSTKQAKQLERLGKLKGSLDKISTPIDDMLSPMALLNKLIGFAIGGAIEYDKRLGDTAKSMNLTYGEADRSNKAMVRFAKATKDSYLNSQDLNKTVVDLNKNLGTSIKFEQLTGALQKDVALMSKLENISGLTAEETQGILQYTLATGQSATKATKDLMANYKVAGLKRGVVLNEKDALKEISKLSNVIKLSTSGSAAGLAKAVASAKALGADLSKVNDIAGSILNFEESIEAELSAELLTGRDLNLEKARQAALNNDLATLSDEIAKNVGSAADFAKMNRIQQDAIAKSVGMTREELADTLTNQEALKNMGAASIEDAQKKFDLLVKQHGIEGAMAEMGDNSLTRQFQQTSMQDEMVQKQKQANDLLIMALGPMEEHKKSFKKILDTIMWIIEKTNVFKGVLIAIGALMAAKLVMNVGMMAASMVAQVVAAKAYNRELDKQGGKQAGILAKEMAITSAKVAGAEAASFGAVTVAILAGLATVGAAIAGFSMMSDGIIGPSGGGGFGDRVLFGPEGAISFNNKDTIVAGTNLFKANDMVSAPAGAINMSGGSKDMDELKGAIMALATRPVDVAIDGTKVIEATTGAIPNTQGVESAKNSYKIQ